MFSVMEYAELLCRSNYSFLEGASFPEELVEQASSMGVRHLGLVDRDGVYGVSEARNTALGEDVQLVYGASMTVVGHPSVALLVGRRSVDSGSLSPSFVFELL